MIKTLQQALKMDREKFKVPRSVQQAIPIQRIWPDGVFQSGTKFSKTFRFSDINYAIASKEDKTVKLFSQINAEGQTVVMVTHSTKAASHANRILFIKDGEVFHQIYRGNATNEQLYVKISDALTVLTTGGEEHE